MQKPSCSPSLPQQPNPLLLAFQAMPRSLGADRLLKIVHTTPNMNLYAILLTTHALLGFITLTLLFECLKVCWNIFTADQLTQVNLRS